MAVIIQRRMTSHPGRAIRGVVPAIGWLALRGVPRFRIRMSRAMGHSALSGLTADGYAALATSIGTELGRDPAWSFPEGVAAVSRHLAAGDEVIVTTGTEELLSRAFLDAVGLQGVTLVATTMQFDGRSARYANHNMGQQKVTNLDERGGDVFYTDSDLDLPLALLSRATFLINPSPRLAKVFEQQVPNLTIENWG